MHQHHVLLTGQPGVGKTTLIKKLSESLKNSGENVNGFYTEEIRSSASGTRIGFDIVSIDGKERGQLARENGVVGPKVGKYSVNVGDLERIALPRLVTNNEKSGVLVIDEIGKMELMSNSFARQAVAVFSVSNSNQRILATIPLKKGNSMPVVDAIRDRKDCKLFTVTRENRDGLAKEILEHFSK